MEKRGFFVRLHARLYAREEGFTLVELMVALGVILVAVLALAYTATIAFSDIALARQRQAADGLASQAIEEARAIPFDTIKAGLSSNDSTVTSDSNIVTCGANMCYGGEQIPFAAYVSGTTIKPLVPHTTSVTVGPDTYTVSTYVTYYNNQTTSNTFRVTVVVTWAGSIRAGASHSIQLQTVVYSPSGCESTATHPFAAPCQPFLYAAAFADQRAIAFTGSLQSVNLQEAELDPSGESSNTQAEQITSVNGGTGTSGAAMTLSGQAQQTVGLLTATSTADNDPGNPGNDFQTASSSTQAGGTLTASGGGNSLSVTAPAGDTGSTTSTTDASVSPSHPCADRTGTNQVDGLPCGSSKAVQGGALSASMTINNGSVSLGTTLLASLAAPVSPTYPNLAHTTRSMATGDGLVHGDATRTLGTLALSDLPSGLASGLKPSAWAGYLVQLTGYTDYATAEAGINAATPTVTQSGTIKFWNGSGYTSCSVPSTSCLSNGAWPVATLTVSGQQSGSQLTITMTSSLKPGGISITDPSGCTTACTRNQASARSNSPITGTITYTVVWGGVTLANLTITVDLGTLLASASYQPAPSAT